MKQRTRFEALGLVCVLACSKPPVASDPAPPRSPELNALMNEVINPAFSKLTFLVFHAETMDDPDAGKRELVAMADRLVSGTQRLSAWSNPPVRSAEGREVFHTYSASMHRYAQALVTAVGTGDPSAQVTALERIAETCNNCHHFFRLAIKDSVVGPQVP